MTVWTPPGFTVKQVRNVYSAATVDRHFGGDVPKPLGLILHVQDGNGGLFGWFDNPDSQASSAWWAGKKGEREQYGDPDTERFWTQVAGNWDYQAVECEGTPDEPMTAEQVETVAQILAAGHVRYGWPLAVVNTPGERGLGWHGMGAPAWGHAYCPGDIRKAQMPAIVTRARQIIDGQETPTMPSATANGWPVCTDVPGPTFTAPTDDTPDVVRDDLAKCFAALAMWLDTEVARITKAWGGRTWAQQMATNPRVTTSNHLSFTACDMPLAGINGYGSRTSGLSWAQEQQIGRILDRITNNRGQRIFEWGNDFHYPDGDPVHWQVRQAKPYGAGPYPAVVSAADVAQAAAKVDAIIRPIQSAVGAVVDGYAGPGTIAAVKKWQKAHGLVVDGIVGPATQAAMGIGTKPAKPKPNPAPTKKHANLKVDGDFGKASVRALTAALGTPVDDVISSQSTSYRRNLHGVTAVEYVAPSKARGSKAVVALQKRVGIKHPDGRLIKPTIRAVQQFLGVTDDGVWGAATSRAAQTALNEGKL